MLTLKDQENEKLLVDKKVTPTQNLKMTSGQYQLHILVQATSGLFTGDQEDTLDVLISIQAFGKKQYTSVKQAVGFEENFWGEHFYFKTKFDNTIVGEGQKLLISVHNQKLKLIESLIGNYQLSIGSIYASQNHTIMHQWLALSNFELPFTEIAGYIKISVSMLGQNDNSLQLEPENTTGISIKKSVMIPPTIKRQNYQLIVEIYQGQNIMLTNGKSCDPFIAVQFGNLFYKTQSFKNKTNPLWQQKFYSSLALPTGHQSISFQLIDYNYIQKNQILGRYYIKVLDLVASNESLKKGQYKKRKQPRKVPDNQGESILSKDNSFGGSNIKSIKFEQQGKTKAINKRLPYHQMQWINFYGPAVDASNEEYKKIYQNFPQMAPYYVGSALIRVKINQQNTPQNDVVRLKEPTPKQRKINFQLSISIGSGIKLYGKMKTYMVMVKIGQFQIKTNYQNAINGFCSWNINKIIGVSFYQNQKVPDMMVYLVDGNGDKICFLRYDPFPKGQQPQMNQQITILEQSWVNLKPDLSKLLIQNEQAGYLLIGLTITQRQNKISPKQNKIKSALMGGGQKQKKGKLIIQLLCARQLMPLDDEGTSDPFFEFIFLDKMEYSSTKEQTLNPIYFQKLIIETNISSNCQQMLPLIVNAYDKDRFGRQFIGTTFINLTNAIQLKNNSSVYGMTDMSQPIWFQLKQNNVVAGKFLASFKLISKNIQDIPKPITIPTQKFVITMLMIGIRSFKQYSILNTNKVYLVFEVQAFSIFDKLNSSATTKTFLKKSISKQETLMLKNIITEPQQANENLNLKMIQKRILTLPQNPNYWPALSVKVKNEMPPGIQDPLVGYFSINLKEAYQKTNESKAIFDKHARIQFSKLDEFQFEDNNKLVEVDQGLLLNLRNVILTSLNYSWPVMSEDIELNDQKSKEKYDPEMVVVFPCYKKVENSREQIQLYKEILQKNGCYMKIGFDDKNTRSKTSLFQRNKHYRYLLNCSLEDYQLQKTGKKIGMFDEYSIRTGRMYPSNNIASNILKNFTQIDQYIGKYKGHSFIEKVKSTDSMSISVQQKKRLHKFLRDQQFHVYLYIIEGFNLPSKDIIGKSDPYLVVKVGDKTFNFEQEYFQDNDNPQFNKKIYKMIMLPSDAILEIQVWDYDNLLGDDLIGSCFVDLENRAFYQENNVVFNNPIETHQLFVKESKISQGSIRFWLDLIPQQKYSLYREFEIGCQLDRQFQVRVIIWNCSEIPENDIQGMSDLYVTCTFNNQTQSTDTHVRATDFGSFNWRCVYNVKLPTKDTYLSFRVFDQDLLTRNDCICSTTFSISSLLESAFQTREPKKLYIGTKDLTKYEADTVSSFKVIDGKKKYDRFQIPLQAKTKSKKKNVMINLFKKKNQIENIGKIQLTVQVVPKSFAEKQKVGKGRQSPNQFPHLPQPKDRFQWSWNPFTTMARLCGRSFRYKLCLFFGLILILYIFYSFFQSFAGTVAANVITQTTDKIIT